jgi:hypothetical protein
MNGKPDLTYLAVRRQIDAMRHDVYEIGIRTASLGKMMSRVWSRAKVLASVAWLKAENAKGADIYVRAANEGAGLVLVDDISLGATEKMKHDGLLPAVLVETSPANYQAWIRLSETLSPQLATAAAKELALRYHGDPASADWRHYGRLAGFTNCKPSRELEDGHRPWVLCHAAPGTLAPAGAEFMRFVERTLKERAEVLQNKTIPFRKISGVRVDPSIEYTRQWQNLQARYGDAMDKSRADFMICCNLLLNEYSPEDVAAAARVASVSLADRKTGHETDYIMRTIKAAKRAIQGK